jgi:hypothetical protein
MKPKKITAKRFWKSASGSYLYPDKKSAQYFSGFEAPKVAPVVVLPYDSASYTAMIAQIKSKMGGLEMWTADALARASLAAIGITKGSK